MRPPTLSRFLATLGLALLHPLAAVAASAADITPACPRDPVVYLMNWRGCEEACEGFQEHLLRLHPTASIVMRNADQRREAVRELVDEARRLRPDVIVTWGNDLTLEVIGPHDAVDPARHVTDIPVVYLYVAGGTRSKIALSEKKTGRPNVAGTDYVVPLSAQLAAMREFREVSRLGMVYDPTQPGSVQRAEEMHALARARRFEFVALPIPLDASGKPDPRSLPALARELKAAKVDFVYFGLSSFLVQHAKAYTAAAVAVGLPVFTSGQVPILKADALLALVTPLHMVGGLAAKQVDAVLCGSHASPGDLPIARLDEYWMTANRRVARQLGLALPLSIVRKAELVE